MPAPTVRSDHEGLGRVALEFNSNAAATRTWLLRLRSCVGTLQAGDWIGRGAQAFFREMDTEVLPSVQRLQSALEAAARTTVQIGRVMQQAEDDTARLLRGEGARLFRGNGAAASLPSPAHPTPDEGSGPFDSISPVAADYAFQGVLAAGAAQWALIQDRPDAARHMQHYLSGSGEPVEVDVGKLLQDEPAFQLNSQGALQTFLNDVESRIQGEYQGQPLSFQVSSAWMQAPYARDENWYYAMGGWSYAYSAEVSVTPPAMTGAGPTVEVQYQMHLWDYYNWDKGKSVSIPRPTLPGTDIPISLPIPAEYQPHIREVGNVWVVQDAALARLHLTGLAREYEITGQTELIRLNYTLDPNSGQLMPSAVPVGAQPPGR